MGWSFPGEMVDALGVPGYVIAVKITSILGVILPLAARGDEITLTSVIAAFLLMHVVFPVFAFFIGCFMETIAQIDDAYRKKKTA